MKSIKILGWILIIFGFLYLFENFIFSVIFITCGLGVIYKQNWARLGMLIFSALAGIAELGSLIANLLSPKPTRNMIQLIFLVMVFVSILWFLNRRAAREQFKRRERTEPIDKEECHKRNRYVFMVLFFLLFFLDIFFPAIYSMSGGPVLNKQQGLAMQVGLNMFLGIFAVPLYIWYALTLEFKRRWYIFLVVGIFYLVGIFFFVYSWTILFAVLEMRGYQLTKKI